MRVRVSPHLSAPLLWLAKPGFRPQREVGHHCIGPVLSVYGGVCPATKQFRLWVVNGRLRMSTRLVWPEPPALATRQFKKLASKKAPREAGLFEAAIGL
jgi:hypothetical protein